MADSKELWNKMWDTGDMQKYSVKRFHAKLVQHKDAYLQGKAKAKIFLPLCGDAYDMKALAEMGHEIVGLECSEVGVKYFFDSNNIPFTEEKCGKVKGTVYKSTDPKLSIKIYACDLFDFNASVEGQFDAIIDFASMAALPKNELDKYVPIMKGLMKPDCRMILESLIYDLDKYPNGRPSCFVLGDMQKYYGDTCDVEILDEGPHPYAEEFAKADEEGTGEGAKEEGGEEEEFPVITGARYFLIKPKK